MPKQLLVNPVEVRQPGTLTVPGIPLNQYRPDFRAETDRFGAEGLKRLWIDMATIREFEAMLDAFKREGTWEGISYNHKGPAHLSIGQEAAAVGQSAVLGPEDLVFGSHRSHGEILAKCLSAARQLDEQRLKEVMEGYLDGEILRAAERVAHGGLSDLAVSFIL